MKDNTLPLKNNSWIVDSTAQRLRCDHLTEQDVKAGRGVAFAVQNIKRTKTYLMCHTCGLDTLCTKVFLLEMRKTIEPDDPVQILYLKSGSWTLIESNDPEKLK